MQIRLSGIVVPARRVLPDRCLCSPESGDVVICVHVHPEAHTAMRFLNYPSPEGTAMQIACPVLSCMHDASCRAGASARLNLEMS